MPKSPNQKYRFWGPTKETVDLSFEAQPRNPRSSSPCAWCRLHMVSCYLPIIRPLSTWFVLDHPRSSAQVSYSCRDPHRCLPCHTYHLHTTRQANTILHTKKGKSIEPRKCPRFEFNPQHVNDSSHIKPRYWSFGFSISPLMSPLTPKSTKFEFRIQDPIKHS
jgi:hypothetical protein